ncbi:MAG: hypothetical protein QOG04_89 [Actinomycetota bacterium]|jgi:hypothetical protein|nr:hypothetical protein [Actinomycetota bacterium]
MHVEWVDDEAVVLNVATGHLHHLNPPAALAYALFLEHGYDKGLEELRRTVGSPAIEDDLPGLLEEMRGEGLLIDD